MSVYRSASGAGAMPFASRRARTKRSMGLTTHLRFFTGGSAGWCSGCHAQCPFHTAPSAIQRRSISVSSRVSGSFLAGGMRCSMSAAVTRRMISLSAGFPGTIAARPLLPALFAVVRSVSRKPPRPLSAPWHSRQWFARIGRTSRSKSTGAAPAKRHVKSRTAAKSGWEGDLMPLLNSRKALEHR